MRWSAADVRGTAASVAPWWSLLTSGVPPDTAAALCPPEVAPFLGDAEIKGFGSADVEGALSALSSVARVLAARGYAMPSQTGAVAGIFAGDGGVPKRPVAVAEVSECGVAGDVQRTRKHHGRIWQALCLWPAEVVEALGAEGHPVFAGACGENVLLRGVDWRDVRPGARMRIGTVLAEVSLPTIPCKQIRPFFTGSAVRRIDHDRHPGWSRWYAMVIEPGRIALGDTVEVEP